MPLNHFFPSQNQNNNLKNHQEGKATICLKIIYCIYIVFYGFPCLFATILYLAFTVICEVLQPLFPLSSQYT